MQNGPLRPQIALHFINEPESPSIGPQKAMNAKENESAAKRVSVRDMFKAKERHGHAHGQKNLAARARTCCSRRRSCCLDRAWWPSTSRTWSGATPSWPSAAPRSM